MAARLGVVTGKNLARVCRERYGRPTYLTLWAMTELAIIGCDLQEIIGSAVAFKVTSRSGPTCPEQSCNPAPLNPPPQPARCLNPGSSP
jgi:NRAMP (natural resistance-associated macrophage protein)-like metal ion transporter